MKVHLRYVPDLRLDLGERIKNENFYLHVIRHTTVQVMRHRRERHGVTQARSTFRVERATLTRFVLHAGKIIFNTHNEDSE
jgi:hypothetical protein